MTRITQAPRNVADTLTMDKRSERSEYTAHAALTDTARMRLPTFAHGVEGPTGRRGGTAAQALAECERAAILKRLGA